MNHNIINIQKWKQAAPPTEAVLQQLMLDEGLSPYKWSNDAGDVYAAHTHSYFKVIYVVVGSITFGFPIDGAPITLVAGDRLDLPAGVPHNAVVGPNGVVCLEAHQ
jgi:quercetin dioxygenase-like cupin family protein